MPRSGRNVTAEEISSGVDLSGKNAIVTGASAGLGLETARVLALRGAHVIMACRDLEKARRARKRLVREGEGRIDAEALELQELDLASLASVRACAEAVRTTGRSVHLLVNNAGVMLPDRCETADGFEAHYGTNHLGHFLLTNLLLEPLRAAGAARVVCVSSAAMRASGLTRECDDLNWEHRRWSGVRAYGSSKLMNLLFAKAFDRRYRNDGIVANALHPGMVRTDLARSQPLPFLLFGFVMLPWIQTVEAGAATTLYASTAPEYARTGGAYLARCAPARVPSIAADDEVQERLWEISAEATGLGRAVAATQSSEGTS